MEIMTYKELFNHIEKKIYKLIIKHNTLQKEHDRVLEENIALKEIIKKQEEELHDLKNREKFTNIVSSITGSAEGAVGLKQRLDEYIEEVDKCIAHLSR